MLILENKLAKQQQNAIHCQVSLEETAGNPL